MGSPNPKEIQGQVFHGGFGQDPVSWLGKFSNDHWGQGLLRSIYLSIYLFICLSIHIYIYMYVCVYIYYIHIHIYQELQRPLKKVGSVKKQS